MSYDGETLYNLLPAIYRIRDAELAAELPEQLTPVELAELDGLEALASPTPGQLARLAALREKRSRGPLKTLLTLFGAEIGVLEENLAQLYDDLFIETCVDWVIPYIGDLIGYQPLHNLGQTKSLARAEVAHTIALRRRKGTVPVLEQLARDVTGWKARAVEYFQLLNATQYMNHLRPHCRYSPDMRQGRVLAAVGTPFETTSHTVDVRRIENRRGRYNIPNIGIFLWRIEAYRHTQSPAVRVDDRRYLISPLGQPLQIYTRPRSEDEITHLAEPINVPEPIRRRAMDAHLKLYYGLRPAAGQDIDNCDPSVVLYVDGAEIARDQVVVCNLAGNGATWSNTVSPGKYAIDPELGRVAVGGDLPVPEAVRVTYHYGFSADLGGGEYSREQSRDQVETTLVKVPGDYTTIGEALTHVSGDGIVEITGSGRYEENLSITVNSGGRIELRSGQRARPTLVLSEELVVTGGEGSSFSLEGLLVAGARLRVVADGDLAALEIRHTTLVPGLALDVAGESVAPGEASLVVEQAGVAVSIEQSIVGPVHVHESSSVNGATSIIDATAATEMAYGGPDGSGHGGALSLTNCTVIGKVRTHEVGIIANTILLGQLAAGDVQPPVHVVRRQVGCIRFSWLPVTSVVPKRYQCHPADAEHASDTAPRFTSLRYGAASYCQLARSTPDTVRRGADDESEMGAYHDLFPAQREANLEIRLQEFLRVGLAAGIFYES